MESLVMDGKALKTLEKLQKRLQRRFGVDFWLSY
jgi:hypothetical protein